MFVNKKKKQLNSIIGLFFYVIKNFEKSIFHLWYLKFFKFIQTILQALNTSNENLKIIRLAHKIHI
jgi:hypothetical protein